MLNIEREMLLAWSRELFTDRISQPMNEPKTEDLAKRLVAASSLSAVAFGKVASTQETWDHVFTAWSCYRESLRRGFPSVLSLLEKLAVDAFHHAAIFESVIGSLIPPSVSPSPVADTHTPAAKCSACDKEAVANGLCEEHASQFVEPEAEPHGNV